jgi:hypothetical protein
MSSPAASELYPYVYDFLQVRHCHAKLFQLLLARLRTVL